MVRRTWIFALLLLEAPLWGQQPVTGEIKEQQKIDSGERFRKLEDLVHPTQPNLSINRPTPVFVGHCFAEAPNGVSEIRDIPVTELLAGHETKQIPWKVKIGDPKLRMDQRFDIPYSADVPARVLYWSSGSHHLTFVSGISDSNGKLLVQPTSDEFMSDGAPTTDAALVFRNCLLVKPGDYVLWMILFDRETSRHNVVKRPIRVVFHGQDPLPQLDSQLASAEFPQVKSDSKTFPIAAPPKLSLPVANKRPMDVMLMPVITPSDQWPRSDILVELNKVELNESILVMTGVLGQLKLAQGSISASAFDLVDGKTSFAQSNYSELNWPALAGQLSTAAVHQVSTTELQNVKERSSHLREALARELTKQEEPLHVLILISAAMLFERGSDLSPLALKDDCNCRLYHVRLHAGKMDWFDDIEKLIKPLRPTTFDVSSPLEFRKALADIINQLQKDAQ